jgi:hypothetical protein
MRFFTSNCRSFVVAAIQAFATLTAAHSSGQALAVALETLRVLAVAALGLREIEFINRML